MILNYILFISLFVGQLGIDFRSTESDPILPTSANESQTIPTYTYQVVNSWPHDRKAFTQGLEYRNGKLYESTGLYGQSSLRIAKLKTGGVLKTISLSNVYFAEGITVFRKKIFQLTWQSQKGFIYDKSSLRKIGEFDYSGEGWGLTNDGTHLIMSDGTNQLRYLNPNTLEVERTLGVTDRGRPVTQINELEFVNDEILANIWMTNFIARIDPATGAVTGWIDLTGLLPLEDQNPPVDVLNGIAYDSSQDRLFVTGKLWPKVFEIQLLPKSS